MSSNNNNNDNYEDDNNDSDLSINGQHFAWILLPLLIIFIVGLVLTFIRIRRHRVRRAQQWPGNGQRVFAPSGHMFFPPEAPQVRGARRSPWVGTRSQEGLNELGEAPPPYEGKKEIRDSHEMHDLEAGGICPPEYPAAPGPAVTTNNWRGH